MTTSREENLEQQLLDLIRKLPFTWRIAKEDGTLTDTTMFRFLSADGVEHEVTYIADDKGFRVTGDTVLGAPQPATTPRPAQTQAPVTEAPAAGEVAHVLTVKTVHAVPVQLVHLAYVLPQTYSSVPFYSGQFQCFYGAAELNRSGEQEVVGFDGARYILKKVE